VIRGAQLALACLVAAGGYVSPSDSQFPSPPPPPFFIVDELPPPGDRSVPTDVVIEVGLSDVPYPSDLPGAWTLSTSSLRVTGMGRTDLPDHRVRVRAARGLLPYIQYTFSISSKLHSFAGAPLAPSAPLVFQTGDTPEGPPPAPPQRHVADVVGAFAAAGCAGGSCHEPDQPAEGLDLSSASGVRAAIGRASIGHPGSVLIVPGDHPDSYLVWKAMGLPRTLGHSAVDFPPLGHDAARVLADWIDQGAPAD